MHRIGILGAAVAMTTAISLPAAAQQAGGTERPAANVPAPLSDTEVIRLPAWQSGQDFAGGWSAESLIDEAEVYGPTGDEIGDVENIVIGPDGRIVSIIAELGGFLDIGDTHVNVPWEEVELGPGRDRITIPVTEDTVERYAERVELAYLPQEKAEGQIAAVEHGISDFDTGPRVWRADELMNDYVQLAEGMPYGWVDDLIFDENGQIQAVVVVPRRGFAARPYAYPWYGYRYGWYPGAPTYVLPYTEGEVAEAEPFEYERLGGRAD